MVVNINIITLLSSYGGADGHALQAKLVLCAYPMTTVAGFHHPARNTVGIGSLARVIFPVGQVSVSEPRFCPSIQCMPTVT